MDEGFVLLWRKIVLIEFIALDSSLDQFVSGGMSDEILRVDFPITELCGNRDPHFSTGVLLVPVSESFYFVGFISAHVSDLDADGAVIGDGGVPGAFFQIEGLIDRAVQIEHKMDAQVAMILEHAEAFPADAADIEVNDELIDDALEQGQIPATAADALDFLGCELGVGSAAAIHPVTIGLAEFGDFLTGG